MTLKTAYKLSLALPFLASLVASALLGPGERFSPLLDALLLFTAFSAVIGAVPYAVLCVTLLLWSRGRDEGSLLRALLISPVLMLPLMWATLLVRHLFAPPGGEFAWPALGRSVTFLSAFVLAFGYFYVAVAYTSIAGLARAGVFDRSATSAV